METLLIASVIMFFILILAYGINLDILNSKVKSLENRNEELSLKIVHLNNKISDLKR